MALRVHQLLHRKALNLSAFCRSSHIGSKDLGKFQVLKKHSQDIHLTTASSYPAAKDIPLPTNVEDINAIETGRFSPQRARDITGDVIFTQSASSKAIAKQDLSADSFLQSYDCTGTVSLNSAMQTNVPDPYTSRGKSSHLNMPGGEWARSDKYVAQDLQNSHYSNIRDTDLGAHAATTLHGKKGTSSNLRLLQALGPDFRPRYFSSAVNPPQDSEENPDKKGKLWELRKAAKDYGLTVVVFHIGISLVSLTGFYLAVTSGIDLTGFASENLSTTIAGEVGSFVVAYTLHKMFLPVRASITLCVAPFIVRYLRKIGFLTKP